MPRKYVRKTNRQFSDLHRARISAGGKGKIISKETREKIRASMLGRKQSMETRLKNSLSKKGKPFNDERRRNISRAKGGDPRAYETYLALEKQRRLVRRKPGLCESCGASESNLKRPLMFDHDHERNTFRGWICYGCNTALGMVHDDKAVLYALIKYLDQQH